MPLYEYVCQKCDSEFEIIVSFSATDMPACPNCEAKDVERKMGLPAIHFKGSGWYINDSKKSKESVVGETKKEDGSSSAESESSKPEKESSADSEKKTDKSSSDTKSESSTKSNNDSGSKAKSSKPKKSKKDSK